MHLKAAGLEVDPWFDVFESTQQVQRKGRRKSKFSVSTDLQTRGQICKVIGLSVLASSETLCYRQLKAFIHMVYEFVTML